MKDLASSDLRFQVLFLKAPLPSEPPLLLALEFLQGFALGRVAGVDFMEVAPLAFPIAVVALGLVLLAVLRVLRRRRRFGIRRLVVVFGGLHAFTEGDEIPQSGNEGIEVVFVHFAQPGLRNTVADDVHDFIGGQLLRNSRKGR